MRRSSPSSRPWFRAPAITTTGCSACLGWCRGRHFRRDIRRSRRTFAARTGPPARADLPRRRLTRRADREPLLTIDHLSDAKRWSGQVQGIGRQPAVKRDTPAASRSPSISAEQRNSTMAAARLCGSRLKKMDMSMCDPSSSGKMAARATPGAERIVVSGTTPSSISPAATAAIGCQRPSACLSPSSVQRDPTDRSLEDRLRRSCPRRCIRCFWRRE